MNFCRKQRGAVSIFLVIILVPMITISSLFVDVSKVMLGKSVMASAGDLALNTALTNYDTVLKDMYGLFATAQDTDELYEKLEDYYRDCIISSGVSADVAETYAESLMAQLGVVEESNNVDDILNMELIDFTAEKYSAGTLANATVLKKQIIEFQKYRAPINTGLSFLTSLQSFATIEKQTELVEKRTAYYEAEQTMMGNAQKAWQAIRRYEKSGILDNNFLTNIQNSFAYDSSTSAYKYQNDYQYYVEKIIMDLYNTTDNMEFNAKTYKIMSETVTYKGNDINVYMFYKNSALTSKETPYTERTDFSYETKATALDIKNKLNAFNNRYNEYLDAKTAFDALPDYDSSMYKVQYFAQVMNKLSTYETWISAMKNLYNAYSALQHAVEYAGVEVTGVGDAAVEVSVMETKGKLFGSDIDKTYSTYYNECMSKFNADLVNTFNSNLSTFNSNFDTCENAYKTMVPTLRSEVKANVVATYNEITDYRKILVDAKTELETAKTYLGYVYDAVKDGGTLDGKIAEWENVADDSDLKGTAIAKQDLGEIQDLEEKIDDEEVNKLVQRVGSIISHLNEMISEVDSYTFYGVKLTEIDSYDTLVRILKDTHGDSTLKSVPLKTTDLQGFVKDSYSGKFTVSNKVDSSWSDDTGTEANLKTNKLKFYSYLYTHFNDSYEEILNTNANTTETTTTEEKEAKKMYENLKDLNPSSQDDSDKAIDEGNTSAQNEIAEVDSSKLPSGGSGGTTPPGVPNKASEATGVTSDKLGSLLGGNFLSAIKNMAEDLRDNLYVSDYILGMFSHDASEAEYLKEHSGESEAKLVSLTKETINKDNNYMYGGEVEYIIYGGQDATNKLCAYGTIYGIRLAFNLVYAFTDAEIRDGAFAIATPISAATLGIVPVPLIQAAIIIAISCCESAIDIGHLKSGTEVPLFKNKQTWILDFNSLVEVAKDTAVKVAKKETYKIVDAASEKMSEFLDMSAEELSNITSDQSNQMMTYFEESCKTLVNRHAGAAIQKFTTLTQVAVDEAEFLLLDTQDKIINYIKNELDVWLAQEADGIDANTDLAYKAKATAVEIIKNNYVDTLVIEFQKPNLPNPEEILSSTLSSIFTRIRTDVTDKVVEKMQSSINDAKDELQSAVDESAEKVKETLNKQLDKFSGGSTGNGLAKDNTGIASLLSFGYSDYLRLFVVIGLYTDEKDVILRAADCIQLNMGKVTGKSDYALSQSAAYVKLTATVQVKPTFLPLPLFADVENNPATDTSWYTLEYSEIKGY